MFEILFSFYFSLFFFFSFLFLYHNTISFHAIIKRKGIVRRGEGKGINARIQSHVYIHTPCARTLYTYIYTHYLYFYILYIYILILIIYTYILINIYASFIHVHVPHARKKIYAACNSRRIRLHGIYRSSRCMI